MIAFDTNILFPFVVSDHPDHAAVADFIQGLDGRDDVALSEFALVELYGLLRQPAVMRRVLDAAFGGRRLHRPPQASALAAARLSGRQRGVHRTLWEHAARPGFSRRRIYDARLALCLVAQGVREFATVNLKDFAGLGFRRVFNPLA